MLQIKVLGPGCPNCKKVESVTRMAVEQMNVQAEIEKITDYNRIMSYEILSTPGLVVNGKVVAYGRFPAKEELRSLLGV